MAGRQKLGRLQTEWIDRIREAGGEIEISTDPRLAAYVKVEGSSDIRIPIRMVESLVERGILIQNPQSDHLYRLR